MHEKFREHFALSQALPEVLPGEPFALFEAWFEEAHAKKVQANPNAMTLATVDGRGQPQARMVLCRGIEAGAGYVRFYTNYGSAKGRSLNGNGRAAVLFHWDALDRQVRIEGVAVRAPAAESDGYFAKRPWESRLGAWSSEQSAPLEDRRHMLDALEAAAEKLGLDKDELLRRGNEMEIPRPPFWGGFRLWAERVELWMGGTGRVHDRAVWVRGLVAEGDGFTGTEWMGVRLQP